MRNPSLRGLIRLSDVAELVRLEVFVANAMHLEEPSVTNQTPLIPKSNGFSQPLLDSFSSGKVFIVQNELTGLILKKDYYAELIHSGSAVGGQFDNQVGGIYTIGDVEVTVPKNRQELQQSIASRQTDIDQMLAFYKERDLLKRAIAVLTMLDQRYGFAKVRAIPTDLLALLVGANEQIINAAWEQAFGVESSFKTGIEPLPIETIEPLDFQTIDLLPLSSAPQKNFKSWQWLAVGAAAIAAVSLTVGSLIYFSGGKSLEGSVAASVSAEPPSVSALGFIEPQGEVIQLSAPAFMEGARIDQLLVRQGDAVKKGAIVAMLDSRDRLQATLDQARTSVTIAEAKLAQVKAGAKTGDINVQKAQYQKSKAEQEGQISTQQATIANLEAQLEGERNTQESALLQTKAELNNARTECKRYEALYKGGAVSASQRDSSCLTESTAKERLAQASSSLNRIVNTRGQQILEAKANLQRTINTLDDEINAAAASRDAVSEVRGVDVQVAAKELESAQSAVKKAQADLAQAYVRSPIDGEVLKVNTWPGELVKQETGIVELGRTSQMYVSAEVYETDVSRVRAGQSAIIRADGVVGELKGTVEKVGLRIGRPDVLGTDPVRDADARVVEVKIRLISEDSIKVKALTNLKVNVVIKVNV